MKEIIAHRASVNGNENSVEGITYYKKLGIGVELDLRNGKNGVYMSHYPRDERELFENACKTCFNSKIKMALHIKEIDAVKETIKLLKKYSITNCFLLNTENVELAKIVGEYQVGFYANQRPKHVPQQILWCDESHDKWYDKEIISEFHEKNKIIYAMSLEAVRPCSDAEIYSEWERLIKLKIDGICTKYPQKLMEFSKRGGFN